MKFLKILIVGFAFIIALQVSSFAQSKSAESIKIALISFEKFSDPSTGIKDGVDIESKLALEFKSQEDEIKVLSENYKQLTDELERIAKSNGHPSIPEKVLKDKLNEHSLRFCKLESKTKFVRLNFEARRTKLFEEINKKIAELLKVFAKEKGYAVVLDSSQNNIVIKGEITDITNEFIQFYNSKTEKTGN